MVGHFSAPFLSLTHSKPSSEAVQTVKSCLDLPCSLDLCICFHPFQRHEERQEVMIHLAICLVFLHDEVKLDRETIITGSFCLGSLPDRRAAAAEGP